MEENSKPAWQSKTNWVALLTALASFVPDASGWISQNPTLFTTVMSGIFIALRFVTKGKVTIA